MMAGKKSVPSAGARDPSAGDDSDAAEERAQRSDHASRMFAWHDQLCLDRELGLSAQRVGGAIRRCVNSRSGDANPSQAWLARALGIDARNVRRGLAELVQHGHLQVIAGRGPRSGNRYRPITRDDLCWPEPRANADAFALKTEAENRTALPSKSVKIARQRQSEKRTLSDSIEGKNGRVIGQSRPPEPLSEPFAEPAVAAAGLNPKALKGTTTPQEQASDLLGFERPQKVAAPVALRLDVSDPYDRAARYRAWEIFQFLSIADPLPKQLRSLARGIDDLIAEGLDFDDHILPAVRRVTNRDGIPRGGLNRSWLHRCAADEARAIRERSARELFA